MVQWGEWGEDLIASSALLTNTWNTHRKWEQKQWKPNAKSSRRLHLKSLLENGYNMWYLEDQGRTEEGGDQGDTKG